MNPYLEALREHFNMPRHHAWLNKDRLIGYAKSVALNDFPSPSWREPVYPEDDFEFVEHLGWGSSINFHFTDIATGEKFKTLWPECKICRQQIPLYERIDERTYRCTFHGAVAKVCSGAFGMMACLIRGVRDDGIPLYDAGFYRSREWTHALARFVFRGVAPVPVIPMLEERTIALSESAWCLRGYGDSWMHLFRRADIRAFADPGDVSWPGVVEILVEEFPSFRDVQYCEGRRLPFAKRAHLFAQMYDGRARSSKALPRLKDPELLILPADYELPRALRMIPSPETPVLEFSPELLRKILAKEELHESSREVIEVRLNTVEAGEIFKEEVNRIRVLAGKAPLDTVPEDYFLWTMGRVSKEPHIMVKTRGF